LLSILIYSFILLKPAHCSFDYGKVIARKRIKCWDRRWSGLLPLVKNMLRRNARVRVGKILQVCLCGPSAAFGVPLTRALAADLHILKLQAAAGAPALSSFVLLCHRGKARQRCRDVKCFGIRQFHLCCDATQ
jgi:hypothetical protein